MIVDVCNLKYKFIKDFDNFKQNLNKGCKKDYSLLMMTICVIENSEYFDDHMYQYLMSTT